MTHFVSLKIHFKIKQNKYSKSNNYRMLGWPFTRSIQRRIFQILFKPEFKSLPYGAYDILGHSAAAFQYVTGCRRMHKNKQKHCNKFSARRGYIKLKYFQNMNFELSKREQVYKLSSALKRQKRVSPISYASKRRNIHILHLNISEHGQIVVSRQVFWAHIFVKPDWP